MIRKLCCSRFSLHKFIHLKFFWTQFKNVYLRGPCSLRPCISRPYCRPKVSLNQECTVVMLRSSRVCLIKYVTSWNKLTSTISPLFCTLISENQGLDKSRSVSNLIKISVPVHLIFFSVCHLNFFQVYGTNLKKNQLTNWKKFRSTEKKFSVQDLKFF